MRKADGLFKLIGLCLLAGVLVAGVLFPIVGAAGVMSNQASETVEKTSSDLADIPPPLVTTITDNAGKPIATLYNQYRIPVTDNQINDAMQWALVSVEDKRFYEHHGVDWKGTLRAAVSNGTGGDTQGASTITQQLVKNYLINVVYRDDTVGQKKAQEQSIARKLKEARIAIQLETKLSKKQIITQYLNIVEFSRQIFGIGAAAHAYFDTTPEKLTVPQAALLAGLVNNPVNNDPWKHPAAATARRNLVMDRMVDNQKLAKADADRFKAEPLGVVADTPAKPAANCIGAGAEAGFFCQYVEDYLLKSGMSKDDLYSGGYTIKTTLDERANHEAKVSAETQVQKTQPYIANTLSLIKPGKDRHEVVALAANRDYGGDANAGQTTFTLPAGVYNTGGAGSTFKIYTSAAVLDKGIAGIYSKVDVPDSYTSHVYWTSKGGCSTTPTGKPASYWYCVGNAGDYSKIDAGGANLQTALATSPNTTFVGLEDQLGSTAPAIDMARRLGLRDTMASNAAGKSPDPQASEAALREDQATYYGPKTNNPGFGAFTLGFSPVSGLEMANVAATLLSGGVWCPPTPLAGVTDRNGKPVQIKEAACEQAVPEGLANTLAVGMSKDDQTGGTSAAAARGVGWDRPMIGKTGTTQLNVSATFVAGTPQLAGAAMTFKFGGGKGGICDAQVVNQVHLCPTGNIFGGRAPARTWFGAMKNIMEGQPVEQLPQPDPKYMGGGAR